MNKAEKLSNKHERAIHTIMWFVGFPKYGVIFVNYPQPIGMKLTCFPLEECCERYPQHQWKAAR